VSAAQPYLAAFLTDAYEWEVEFTAATRETAKAAAKKALEDLVRDEAPKLACVTLMAGGVKVGVWDWVEEQAHWTPL
jgi:hypothetical protein